jgi:ribosomal protein S18 acetylase RimI-like enzyme
MESGKPGKKTMVKFRIAELIDIPDLLDMMAQFYAIDGYPFDAALNDQNLRILIENPGLGRLWIIIWRNQTVGYVVLTFGFSFEYKGKDGLVDEFFIVEEYRHQGIGKSTINYVIKEAQNLGLRTLHLEVEKHNDSGKKLYSDQGFISKGRMLLTKDLYQT